MISVQKISSGRAPTDVTKLLKSDGETHSLALPVKSGRFLRKKWQLALSPRHVRRTVVTQAEPGIGHCTKHVIKAAGPRD